MKHVEARPFADPEAAARKLVALAAGIEPVQDGRIHIDKINCPFIFKFKATGEEFGAGVDFAIGRGGLWRHESKTYVKLLPAGEDLLR
jgi:hypothetical protein